MPVVAVVPFAYRASIVRPRHRSTSGANVRGSATVVLDERSPEDMVPVVSCTTGSGRTEWFSLGGRISRRLLDSTGSPIAPASFVAALTDPDTDWNSWADYPFDRYVRARSRDERTGQGMGAKSVRIPCIERDPPFGTHEKAHVEHRQWVSDDHDEVRTKCEIEAGRLVVVGDAVAKAEELPRIVVDASRRDVLHVAVRTRRESSEDRMLRREARSENGYGFDVEEYPSFPLEASGVLASIAAGFEGATSAGDLLSVEWRIDPVLSDAVLADMRATAVAALADFRNLVDEATMERYGIAAIRTAADFAEKHDAFLDQGATMGEAAETALACHAAFSTVERGTRGQPIGTSSQSFLLKAAVATDRLAPEAVLTDDDRRAYGALVI